MDNITKKCVIIHFSNIVFLFLMEDLSLYFFITHIMTAVVSLFLGVFVLLNARNKMNIVFFLLSICIALWSFFYAIWIVASSYDDALVYSRFLNFFSIFIPVLYLHWVCIFLKKGFKNRFLLTVSYSVVGIITIFSFSQLFIVDVKKVSFFEYYPQSGPIHTAFLYFWVFAILYSMFLLFFEYKNASGEYKKQIFFILTGSAIGFGGGAFNWFLMFGIDSILPFFSALVLFVPLLLGYAIMKHNLMDIKLALINFLIIILNAFAVGFIFIAHSVGEYIARIIFALISVIISYLLKRSYDKEVRQKEELMKLSNELKRANTELMRLDKAKSEFISIASHQLRTPLTAIKGYISLILEGAYGANANKTDDALNKIFLANERLIQLVEDLLNITRIESGRLELHLDEKVQVEEIVEELRDMFILRTQDKKLDFVVKIPDKLLSPIKADRSKLREVISNLIDNAIKYTNEGFIHVSMEEERGMIRVIVEDSGVGISEESMKTLFTKFSRGTDSAKIYTEGTGLGLYVGKNLVESQGGRVYAESEGAGKGSRFIVEMPIQKKK